MCTSHVLAGSNLTFLQIIIWRMCRLCTNMSLRLDLEIEIRPLNNFPPYNYKYDIVLPFTNHLYIQASCEIEKRNQNEPYLLARGDIATPEQMYLVID